jgi:hypothetical protein
MKIYHEQHSIPPAGSGQSSGHPLREVRYKGWIYRDITEIREPLHNVKYSVLKQLRLTVVCGK